MDDRNPGEEFLIYKERPSFWGALMFLRHSKGEERWREIREAMINSLTSQDKATMRRIVDAERGIIQGRSSPR